MVAVAERILVDDAIDNQELVVVLWRRRGVVLACTLACAILLGVLGFLMTPVYRGTAILVPVNTDRSLDGGLGSSLGSVGGLAALAGLNLGSKESSVEETLAVLKSRHFTEAFIVRNNLLPLLFPKSWDARTGNWKVGVLPPTLNQAYHIFDNLRTVTKDSKTGLITLQVDWTDRAKAAEWANLLVQQLNDEMRSRAIAQSSASMGYLEKELAATTDVNTREAVSRLMESQIKQRMLANVTREYALRFVDQAMVSDQRDKVSPRKALMIGAGFIFGAALGCGLAVMLNARTLLRQRIGRAAG